MAHIRETKPDPKNARRHTPRNVGLVESSIQRDGFGRSILLANDGTIIAGNATSEAAVSAGIEDMIIVDSDGTKIIAVRRTDVAPGSERFTNLALSDNRAAELADWDSEMLRQLADEGADLSQFWFDDELDALLANLDAPVALTDPDAVPDPPKEPTTKPGDIWLLGRHRLLCGDSTVVTDVERLMNGEKAAMVFTDPPYAIYGSSTGIKSDIADDKMIRPFLRDVLLGCLMASKPFAHVFICCDWRSYATWVDMAKVSNLSLKGCMVWDKGDGGLGSMFQQCHEFIAFFVNDGVAASRLMNADTSGQRVVHGHPNIWRYPRVSGEERQHNAAKPVEMVANALTISSDVDALVLDLFGGSGSTLIACEQTGRRAALMEIDATYCDVIRTRWENLTGQTATLERRAD